jgi:hypothetical protein
VTSPSRRIVFTEFSFHTQDGLIHHVTSDNNLGGFAHLQAVLIEKGTNTDTQELKPFRIGRVGGLGANQRFSDEDAA